MKTHLAKIISFIFHPVVFMVIAPFLIAYHQSKNILFSLQWIFFSGFFLFITLLLILLIRKGKFFSDFDIYKKEDRRPIYLLSAMVTCVCFIILLFLKGFHFPLTVAALSTTAGIIFMRGVNFFVKASLHLAIVCAFVLTVGILYSSLSLLLLLWIIPLVGWARITLKQHTLREVIVGICIGSGITLATFLFAELLY